MTDKPDKDRCVECPYCIPENACFNRLRILEGEIREQGKERRALMVAVMLLMESVESGKVNHERVKQYAGHLEKHIQKETGETYESDTLNRYKVN